MTTLGDLLGKDITIFDGASGFSTCRHVIRNLLGTGQLFESIIDEVEGDEKRGYVEKRDFYFGLIGRYIAFLKTHPDIRNSHQAETGYQSDLSAEDFVKELCG
jgi:hypothetical protein